jgi:hypothetical protein
MFRREVFDHLGGYNPELVRGEDQDLFLRMVARGRVVTLSDALYSYRYHATNTTTFNGKSAVQESQNHAEVLTACYMFGAMRLWAGEPPMMLEALLRNGSWRWDAKTAMILVSALWGHLSPGTLRLFMRLLIRSRDLLAAVRVRSGHIYEWRLK